MKRLAIISICTALALCLSGCSSEKVWYEDEDCVISGFSVIEEADGIYSAKGTVETKGGVSSKLLMADVTLLDKDGNEVAKTIGMATDIPQDGSADFLVPFYDGDSDDFMSKEQVDSIASYEISDLFTQEGLEYAVKQKREEAEEAEEALRRKYPNEDL